MRLLYTCITLKNSTESAPAHFRNILALIALPRGRIRRLLDKNQPHKVGVYYRFVNLSLTVILWRTTYDYAGIFTIFSCFFLRWHSAIAGKTKYPVEKAIALTFDRQQMHCLSDACKDFSSAVFLLWFSNYFFRANVSLGLISWACCEMLAG